MFLCIILLCTNLHYCMNRHYIWPHSRNLPKSTCKSQVNIWTGMKKQILQKSVLFSAYATSTYKTVLCWSVNWNTKTKSTWFFKGTAISANELHICIFFSTDSPVCLRNVKLDFFNLNRNGSDTSKMSLLIIFWQNSQIPTFSLYEHLVLLRGYSP